jgi:hypothetical protein
MIALMLVFVVAGCATPPKQTEFSKVYSAPGLPKAKIYDAAKIWIAENFRSAKRVIEYENPKTATLIGNGGMPYPCSAVGCIARHDWNVTFTMRMDAKDERFRLTFSNVGLFFPPTGGGFLRPYSAGYNGPVRSQEQMDSISPRLLAYGDELLATIVREKRDKNW